MSKKSKTARRMSLDFMMKHGFELSDEYQRLFTDLHPTALSIWRTWQEAKVAYGSAFVLYETNKPGNQSELITFLPGHLLNDCATNFAAPIHPEISLNCLISDLTILKQNRLYPPTILVWYDGDPKGSFVSQFCSPSRIQDSTLSS